MEAVVYPFSFREALRHAGREPDRLAEQLPKAQRSRLEHDLNDYLAKGGFPEAQGLDERNRLELLRTYVDVVLLRDVVERHNLSQPQILRWLVQQLLGNMAGTFSITKFHSDLKSRGVAVAKDTLYGMLDHLEDAFLVTSVGLATTSPRRRQVNPRKIYPVDTGLALLFDRSGKLNLGHALETVVLHELQRRNAEIGYVRTPASYEVDFHARSTDGNEELIQVCANLDDPDTLHREVRALEDAQQDFPAASLHLITMDAPATIAIPENIQLHKASDWLLRQLLH